MKCPACASDETKVYDTRPMTDGSIRRKRICCKCHTRFTTYETIETENSPIVVVKRDGSRQIFDHDKILSSIIRACDKRHITRDQMENVVNNIEYTIRSDYPGEVPSSVIGELVMDRIKQLDEVAYIRFASVYRQFKDINDFLSELNQLKSSKTEEN